MITEPVRQQKNRMEEKRTSFDDFGRLNPSQDAIVYNQTSRRYFTLRQPEIHFGKIHANIQKHLPNTLSVEKFETSARKILEDLKSDPQTRNLLKGIHVPFFLSPTTTEMDYGQELETYLTAVGNSFCEHHPKYKFTNYCQGTLAGGVKTNPHSRHEKLIQSRKRGSVVGWYFPSCLSEYALPSQRAAVASLPSRLLLSGGLDASAAFIGSPDLLLKKDDIYPPLLSLAALEPADNNFFFHFEAYGWNLTFNRRSYRGPVSEYWAGGLTVIEDFLL